VVVTAAVEFETRESNNSPRPGEGSSVSKNTTREDVLNCPPPPPLDTDTLDMPGLEMMKESADIDESDDDESIDTLVAFLSISGLDSPSESVDRRITGLVLVSCGGNLDPAFIASRVVMNGYLSSMEL